MRIVPRYDLEVGQELTSHASSQFNDEGTALGHETEWTDWVLRRNNDDAWRLVRPNSIQTSRSLGGGGKSR